MGTWGSGNLQCDGALDEIGERSAGLIKKLWTRAQNSESWEADEGEHDALFVDFEIMFALEAGHVFNGWDLPAPADVDRVCERWLAGWDEYFQGMGASEEFAAERRGVIEVTFARFREICAKYHARRTA